MQLKLSFSTLLAGVLLACNSVQDAEARPLAKPRNAGVVTLPLKRVEQRSEGIHPQIYLQQHINRGTKRLARMTGREVPSDHELSQNLHRRMLAVESSPLSKRFNRSGFKSSNSKRYNRNGLRVPREEAVSFKKGKKGGKAGAVAAGAAGAGVGAAVGVGAGAGAGTSKGNGTSGAQGQGSSGALPDGVEAANQPTADNSLGLNIEANDVGFLATIQMGTPPKDFLILMDSGSADLWVGAENCQSSAGGGCGNHNFLGPQSSSSFQDSQQPFQVTYGTGAVAGTIVQDNIVVAGLKLDGHTFGTAQEETPDFSDDAVPFDGLMGLAQSTLSEQKTLTPIEALAKQGLVQEAITSYKIPRAADNKNDGEITFGGLDQTKFDPATLVTVDNVSKTGFWEAAMDGVTVDGQDTQLQGRTAILDTGTTLIIAPPQDALAVHQLIDGAQSDGQGGFAVPCNFNQSVALSFGGTTFAIDPRDIAIQDPANPNAETCLSGISAGNVGGATEWLVGDVFLKNAYFSTNVGKNTLSLAKLV
ncbi:aspartic-type endopeptidase [Moniliophthora roreri]|uniref:Putative acid protease n=1 Tax=Moniliophthora roreri TaxID=221103 RepID=A0A0W0F753_MONRR|nr:aspartic-type endopeptidase [Moniliophthora roreri]